MGLKKLHILCLILILAFAMTWVYTGCGIVEDDGPFFLDYKGKGDCDTLTGDVLLTVILVDDLDSAWTEADIADYKKVQNDATNELIDEAESYGAELDISFSYIQCQIEDSFDMDDYSDWVSNALKAANLPTEKKVISHLKAEYSVKEAPVIFAVNREGRSFALSHSNKDGFEFAILYRQQGDYRHELLHLFGARDYYYPSEVKEIAQNLFGDSIMMTSGEDVVDSFTAYLIGWQEEMSQEAKQFADETAWITKDTIDEAHEQETLTGQGTIRYGEGTYTGDLVDGIPHGNGKIVWDDGNTYDGQWDNGKGTGYGTIVWSESGNSYSGYWENWKKHGQGTYTFADGTTKTGRWEYDKFVG